MISCRTKKVIECAFEMIAGKWRILVKSIETDFEMKINITKCGNEGIDSVVLLNFSQNNNGNRENQQNNIKNSAFYTQNVRNLYKAYFVSNKRNKKINLYLLLPTISL